MSRRPDQPAENQLDLVETAVSKGDKSVKEKKEAEEAAKQAATQAANQESLKAALAKLTKDSLARGEPLFQKAWAKFQEAIDMLPEEERNKPLKPQQVTESLPILEYAPLKSGKEFDVMNSCCTSCRR